MIFKDLISSVNYDKVWEVLDREYNYKEGAYKAYKKVIEELKSLKPKQNVVPAFAGSVRVGTTRFRLLDPKK